MFFVKANESAVTREADRLNSAFGGELKEEDDIVLGKERTRLLTFAVPNPGLSNV